MEPWKCGMRRMEKERYGREKSKKGCGEENEGKEKESIRNRHYRKTESGERVREGERKCEEGNERPWRVVAEDIITLTPGRKEYQNAKIAVQSIAAAQLTMCFPHDSTLLLLHTGGKRSTFEHCRLVLFCMSHLFYYYYY